MSSIAHLAVPPLVACSLLAPGTLNAQPAAPPTSGPTSSPGARDSQPAASLPTTSLPTTALPTTAPASAPAAAAHPIDARRDVAAAGSLTEGVRPEDISFTLRATFIKTVTVSPHDPNTAYVGSWGGHVFKTTDGGRTWDESRLIIDPRPYYGDGWQRLYFGVHRQGAAAWRPRHRAGEIGGMAPDGLSRLARQPRPGDAAFRTIDPSTATRHGAAANVNFGIGLPGSAPRLQNVVRKFAYGRPDNLGMVIGASGLNIKQTLLLRGVRPTEVRLIVVHPKHPEIVYACTYFGLYKSRDGGLTWVRIFQGINARGRKALSVAVDPLDERNVLLSTGNGLYVSRDSGETFTKSTAQGLGENYIDWVLFDPDHPRFVFVATNYGLLRSEDRGNTWRWIYFTSFPTARVVRYVEIDPIDKKRGYIATHDGIFTTTDIHTASLEDWRRLGGLRFTASEVWKVAACTRHPGHLWAMTNTRLPRVDWPGNYDTGGAFVWESLDRGRSWRIIYSGQTKGSIQWFDNHPSDPDRLWIAWSRALVRFGGAPSGQRAKEDDDATLDRVAIDLSHYPPIDEVLIAAQRFFGVEMDRRLRYRRLARLRALVPRLDASFTHYRLRDYLVLHDARYHTLPFRRAQPVDFRFDEFRLMLTWDLGPLVFNLEAAPFGRIYRINDEFRGAVEFTVHRFYGELRRLVALMADDPPDDLRVRLTYRLRIEELTSYVDLVTGGYLTRYRRGDQPSPWDTPWFERWPGTGRRWFSPGR